MHLGVLKEEGFSSLDLHETWGVLQSTEAQGVERIPKNNKFAQERGAFLWGRKHLVKEKRTGEGNGSRRFPTRARRAEKKRVADTMPKVWHK